MVEAGNWKIVVVDALIEKNNKIVLIRRANTKTFNGMLAFPGGKIDKSETVEGAVVREVKEEIGMDVKPVEILGIYSDPKRDPRGVTLGTAFICDIVSGGLKVSDEASSAEWYNINEINSEELAFDHAKILEDFKKWKKKKGTYWSSK